MVCIMSIAQVKLYCTNCGIRRTYQPGEEVPRQCPQCQRDSRSRYGWLRKKVPFLPALVSLGLLFSLGPYDLFVTRAQALPWLPYVVALAVFGGVWMLATLLLNWPKLPKGPHLVSEIRWSRQDTPPREIVGLKIVVRLEGHYPRRTFPSTIEGYIPILMDPAEDESWENDRVYVLRPDQNSLETGPFLFHPDWVQFKRGALKKLRKECGVTFSYRASMEELILNQGAPFKEIYGIIYKPQNPDTLTMPKIPWSLLKVMNSAYGRVGLSREGRLGNTSSQ